MNKIILKHSLLESTGFKIYEAEINSGSYYAYQFQDSYDEDFKLFDIKVNSKYLRTLYLFNPNSKYVFFVNQGNLRIADLKILTQNEIIVILSQIAIALYDLHQMKSMGRCFNIHNILIINSPQIQVKLMDFGFGSPLLFRPVESNQNSISYDLRLDLFLLGRVIYFLCTGDDIQIQHNYKEQYRSICKKITSKDYYSYEMKDIICKLLHPISDDRCSFIKLFTFLHNQEKDFDYSSILNFYSNLKCLQQEIVEKIQNRENKFIFTQGLVPPQIYQPALSLRDKLIYCFEPQDLNIHKFLNFYLYKIKLINLLLENIQLNLNQNQHISIPLSIFVLKKMRCILFLEFEQILNAKQIENFPKEELKQFRKSQEQKECLKIIQTQIQIEKEQINFSQLALSSLLKQSYGTYQQNQLYIQASSILNDNCNGLTFDRIKAEYRYPLNNVIDQIEGIKDQKIFAQTRLLTMMCLLINKILRIELLDLHFNTIKKHHLIEKITSPVQIDIFLHKADFEQLNNQYNELKAIHFDKN